MWDRLALALGALSALGACVSTSNGGDLGFEGTGASNGGPSCTIQFSDTDCDHCMQKGCAEPCEDCQTNLECNAILTCLTGCGSNNTCANACLASHPDGGRLFATYMNGTTGCIAQRCANECDIDTNQCMLQSTTAGCNECVNQNCLSQCQNCAGNVECLAALDCIKACDSSNTGCQTTCWNEHPYGEAPLLQLLGPNGCLTKQCPKQCQ
jgi:hypothetical protein